MKKKLWKLPISIVIAVAIVLLGGGILIYALTKSTTAAGPVGYWTFDEGAGNTAYDVSGNNNNGTLTNFNFDTTSGWTTGKVAGALKFDGVNDYVSVANSASLGVASTNKITISAWVKWTGTTTNDFGRIIDKEGSGTGYVVWIGNDRSVGYRWNASTTYSHGTGLTVGNNT